MGNSSKDPERKSEIVTVSLDALAELISHNTIVHKCDVCCEWFGMKSCPARVHSIRCGGEEYWKLVLEKNLQNGGK